MSTRMLNFQVKGGAEAGEAAARRMGKSLRIIHYAVSLGHHRTLVCWLPSEAMIRDTFSLEGRSAEAYRNWAGEGVFRLSVGLEDADDLIADLDRVL